MTRSNQVHTQPRWSGIDDAADYIAANPRTIRRMIADGTITGYRLRNRVIRVDLNELDAALTPIPTTQVGA